MNEMKRMMKGEMDQFHERLGQIESNQVDQPRNTTNGYQRMKELKMINLIVKALMEMMTEILAKGDMVDNLEEHEKGKMIIWAVSR